MKARLILNEIKQSVEGSGLGALGVGRSGIINKIIIQIKEVLDKWVESYEINTEGFPDKKITVLLKYNSILHYSYENYILVLISYIGKFDYYRVDANLVPEIKSPRQNLITFALAVPAPSTTNEKDLAKYYVQRYLESDKEYSPTQEFEPYVRKLKNAGYICLSSSLQYRRGILFLYDIDNFMNYTIDVNENNGYVSFSTRTLKGVIPMKSRDVKEKTLDGYVDYLINEKLPE